MKRKMTTHIRRAWPEFGKVPALCGADPAVGCWGGMASATCVKCLQASLYAGHFLDLDVTVVRRIFRRMKRLGVKL